MRPDQVFNQKQGPHTIEVLLSSQELLGDLEPVLQEAVAQAVGKAIAMIQEQLKKQGVHTEFKQV